MYESQGRSISSGPEELAARRVAQVGRDAAIVVSEFLHRVERRALALVPGDRGVLSASGDDQQREAGADVLKANADVAFSIERSGAFPFSSGLRECVRRSG